MEDMIRYAPIDNVNIFPLVPVLREGITIHYSMPTTEKSTTTYSTEYSSSGKRNYYRLSNR